MHGLHRLRYVTRRYAQLQGLAIAPLGIPFLCSALWRDGALRWAAPDAAIARVWFVALAASVIRLSFGTVDYYRARFGDVRAAPTLGGALAASVFAALFAIGASLQASLHTSVSIPAVIVALGLGYAGTSDGIVRSHYLAIAGCVALFAVLGAIGVPLHTRDVVCDQLTALAFMVIGVGDDLVLRRTLVPVAHVWSLSTPFEEMSSFDRLLHEPARLAILTALNACRSCDFAYLQALTALTKGNLSNHLHKLESGGLVRFEKRFRRRVPQTIVSLTPRGREAIDGHWTRLEALWRRAKAFPSVEGRLP